jgi:hypothetical protein
MQSAAITLALVVAVVLFHFSYIDFRFRYRGGIRWFWLVKGAPPLIFVARGAIVVALLLALSTPLIGLGKSLMLVLGVLIAMHVVSLILLELSEPR